MSKIVFGRFFAAIALCCSLASSQSTAAQTKKIPPRIPPGLIDTLKQQLRAQKLSHLSAAAREAISSGRIAADSRSFATWQGSFTYQGIGYPFTMAGGPPNRGGVTFLDSSIIFLNFKFEEFTDSQGNNIVIDTNSIMQDVLGSPNFVATDYTDGTGQFGDAVQRASFFNVAKRNWHTVMRHPRMLKTVTILVPFGQSQVFEGPANGEFVAFVNGDFLFSQIQTILQLENIRTQELVMLVSGNVSGDIFLGFHDAIDVGPPNDPGIQTYLFTSWLNEDLFGPIFADATTLTHEVSEWIADPFINNIVPDYVIPNSGGFCQNFLEVGDPIEFLDNQMFPITVNGHLYHTQTETLLPWFSRQVPSNAFQGAYSYPDTSVLLAPSDPCPTP
jgi:hypothetical protein